MVQDSLRRRGGIDVFRYLDYRLYLADLYKAQKSRGLTYRGFARRAQVGAPNYLKLVMDGERNLTLVTAKRFAEACGLSGEAAQYFVELVSFCQARTASAKRAHHQKLLSYRRYREAHKLDASQAAYHSAWYLPAIRELVAASDFREDERWIARKLLPAIRPEDVRHALATLLKLGLLERDVGGRLQQSSAVVSTGAETRGVHIASYHAEMMQRAVAAIDLVPGEARDISSLTVCVGAAGMTKLKQRMKELRRELLELAEADSERSQVVQMNFQIFPLSRALAEEDRLPLKRPHAQETSREEK